MILHALQLLFWIFVALVLYTYFGYPLILALLGFVRRRHVKKADITPSVSVILSAHNEERFIGKKLDELLSMDYPQDKVEIIVVSDGSADRTNKVVNGYASKGVILCPLTSQKGKTYAQNVGVQHAKNEILLFTDVTASLESWALRKMVAHFCDNEVGCVSGKVRYHARSGNATEQGLGLYAKYEAFIRRQEGRIFSLLGATGCIYAIRRDLYEPLRSDQVSDLLAPLDLLRREYRTVYEEGAIAWLDRELTLPSEFTRRSRIALQGLRLLWHVKYFFNPLRYPFISFALFSHRLLRWSVWLFLLTIFILNVFLLTENLYKWIFILQVMFYGSAILGSIFGKVGIRIRLFNIPVFFCTMNLAALYAFFRLLRGEKGEAWRTVRA